MDRSNDETTIAYPEVVTLHWEGPVRTTVLDPFEEHEPEASGADRQSAHRSDRARSLWEQIESAAHGRGDPELWRRKLAAYRFVKLERSGTAGDYARRHRVNHATVRSWIAEVSRLAYEVGYRLHEDRLLLVGEAPQGLARLRALVNTDAASPAAWQALLDAEAEFRGEDPYFHLNEGHVLRARGALAASDTTLKEGLAIAEARRIRALLWNARGQTAWDRDPDSPDPLDDHLAQAEQGFRRAAVLDSSIYFPFVNLTQLAVDAGDLRRAEYWSSELATARKGMDETMKDDLAKYLAQAEWAGSVEDTRFWRAGPLRWLREATRRGVLALVASLFLAGAAVPSDALPTSSPDVVAHDGGKPSKGGAGGN